MMNKLHLRRLLIIFSCVIGISLSSCSSFKQTPDTISEIDTSVLPEGVRNLSFDEHLDISIGYWNIDNLVRASQPDEFTQYIESLFNITIHPVSVTWSNYKERYQILGATDSLPDVFATLTISSNDNNDSATFVNMIETSSIQALPTDLSSFPAIEALMESVSYTKYTDGNYYALPRFSFINPDLGATDAAMLVRRDWMNHLGIQDPQNFEEFAQMLIAFAKDDPDGNGKDDTIGYNVNTSAAMGKWVILGIAPECNTYTWIHDGTRYVPSWSTEEFKDVITSYRYLYKTGGLDPDFYTKTPQVVLDDFASGRLGAFEYKSSPNALKEVKEKWDTVNDMPFEECVDVLPIYPAPDGVRYSNSSNVFWSESFISASASDAKVERILALYEFLLSENGRNLGKYGFYGVDYTILEDGTYECLLDVGEDSLTTVLTRKYPSITMFSALAAWGGDWGDFDINPLNNLRFGEACISLSRKSALWSIENTTMLERPYDFMTFPKESTEIFSTAKALDQVVDCIIGPGEPLEKWEQYLSDLDEAGFQEYIDRQNRNFGMQK